MLFPTRITKALVAIICVSNVGLASTVRHDVGDNQYTSFANNEFPNVGAMLFSDGAYDYLCTGTLIHPEWVLTAAHCVEGASNIRFRTGANFLNESDYVEFPATGPGIPHPDWNGDLAKGFDIGLFKLANGGITGITPATLFTGSDERGNVGYSVGYGQTGAGNNASRTIDGQKRVNENDIDVHWQTRGKNNAYFGMDFDHPTITSYSSFGGTDANSLEGSTLFGDSGGGTFILVNGDYQIAGVNSFISAADGSADGSYGDRSGQTRVALYADWINQTISDSSGGGGSNNGGGRGKKNAGAEVSLLDEHTAILMPTLVLSSGMTTSVPEPSTLTLTGWIAVFGFMFVFRRQSACRRFFS